MIGYYVHHHGFGHLARAISICERMHRPVTVLTSRQVPEQNPFTAVVGLPRDDTTARVSEPTAHGALHWAPHHDPGYGCRMDTIARWVRDAQPEVFVVDVSVEVAAFVRLLGVPVVVMALPGNRDDSAHRLVHQLADQIIAAWPGDLRTPSWLRPHRDKTAYVGGISRFDGRARRSRGTSEKSSETDVLVLGGADGGADGGVAVGHDTAWATLGAAQETWTGDPWPQICAAGVVVTHAGQGCVADVAAAERPAVVIPQPRPFDEQCVTAQVLARHGLAAVATDRPRESEWPALLSAARAIDPAHWRRWQVRDAASRAAEVIEATARRCRGQDRT